MEKLLRTLTYSSVPVKWILAALLEGYLTIALEILTLRQLLPVLGNSIIITSLVIGTVLLFMAFGYHQGGKTCKNPPKRLKQNFLMSSIIIGVGLSTSFVQIFFYGIAHYLHLSFYEILFLYLLMVIAPCIFCLSQTAPTIMNSLSTHISAGRIGGTVLAISTIGAFAGSFFLALVLMQYFGVSWTVVLTSFLALLLYFMFQIEINKTAHGYMLMTAFFVICTIYTINIPITKNWFLKQNAYGDYEVVHNKNQNDLIINNSLSSRIELRDQSGFQYIEAIKKILFVDMHIHHKKILAIGAGGFTLTASGTHDNQVTYLDIDKQLPKIVTPEFLKKINGNFIAENARYFLNTRTEKYDAIVSDAYNNICSIPTELTTLEYFQSVREHLQKNGVAIFNIIADTRLQDNFSQRINRTLLEAFHDDCFAQPLNYTHKINNIIYVCYRHDDKTDKGLYSDNKNTSAFDSWSTLLPV